jgi:hypothetical protein
LPDFGFELVRETKSQHPSFVETVLNGCPGSGVYSMGLDGGALHSELAGFDLRCWLPADEINKTDIKAIGISAVDRFLPVK